MFEKQRANRAAKRYERALSKWHEDRDELADLVQTARMFRGIPSSEIMLRTGEAVFYVVTGAALIEERRGAGQWNGRSSGVSIPLGLFRYRVGRSRGHFVQGAPVPTAIDRGTLYITNQRVIFQGGRQTRECQFAKLIGFEHSPRQGSTTFSVANRQKPTTIHYGPNLSGAVDFRLDLALAHFKGSVGDLVAGLSADLARLDGDRPSPPPAAPT